VFFDRLKKKNAFKMMLSTFNRYETIECNETFVILY